jgi:phytoene synthase
VDDVVDLGGEPSFQRRELVRWRQEVALCYEGVPQDPVTERLAQVIRTFPIPRIALEEILAGVQMDLERSSYETFEELSLYCYRVAGAVGLCCIEIFGYTDPRARDYAINLGTALQLTNILRDLQADAERGRVYLPQEDLRRFGVSAEDLRAGRYTPEFVALMRFEAERARQFYARARAALPREDERRLFAAEIMGRIYYSLLRDIESRRFRVFGERISVPITRKLAIALRCWAGAHLRVAA